MRRGTLAALGVGTALSLTPALLPTPTSVGALSALTPLSVLAPVTVFGPAPAAADALQPFPGCDELLDWYVDSALPEVSAWGLGMPGYYAMGGGVVTVQRDAVVDTAVPLPASAEAAVGSGDTGTNVQEAGVDEPDFVKTDGRLVVRIHDGELVITDVTGEPRELSRTRLAARLRHGELLLAGNRVVVLGQGGGFHGGPIADVVGRSVPYGPSGSTYLTVLDIGDPTSPLVVSEQEYDGGLVSARQYDGVVRLVLGHSTPRLDFVHPTRERTPQEARRENRQVVRDSTLEDWLPATTGDGTRSPLLDCADVRHPGRPAGLGTVTVVSFHTSDPAVTDATAVTAGGHLVYSSTDRLYVATADSGWAPRPAAAREPTTEVHAFALDGITTSYVASGEVPGTVRDRWSFSEYDGYLRVATALGPNPWSPRENAVVVLEERAGDLVEVGRVGAMGIHEDIQSVRWFGKLAVLVTFRQVDPLYTVDLSDPAAPRVLGELKIPGFSSYLHPIGDDRLLGLGQDATLQGRSRGAQAAVFEIADLTAPRRLGTVGFGRFTELFASWDPRAFTYLPDRSTALTTLQDHDTGTVSLVALRVRPDGSLEVTTRRLGGWRVGDVRTLPLSGGTVALVAGGEVTELVV